MKAFIKNSIFGNNRDPCLLLKTIMHRKQQCGERIIYVSHEMMLSSRVIFVLKNDVLLPN